MEVGRDVHGIKSLSRYTLEQMIALSSEGILLADAQNPSLPIVYANPAYEGLSGYSLAELAGQGWPLVEREADGECELQRLKAAIGRAEGCRVTVPDLRKDGSSWLAEISVEPIHNARGDLKYFLCIHQPANSVSAEQPTDGRGPPGPNGELSLLQRELGRVRQKMASLDRVDPSTGLLRFGYFQDTLRRDLAIARREERFVTLLVFEIVELEAYRQTFGTKAADSCQRMIGAQIMRTLRRAGDLCARYDDSALVAAVLGQTPDEVQSLADQIGGNVRRLGLHNPRAKSGRYITVESKLVGCPPGTQEDAETLVSRALTELRDGAGAMRVASR
jgi:PAS domain S-box-containing protein/diguanylate cyclase (GGDEF)-like protein